MSRGKSEVFKRFRRPFGSTAKSRTSRRWLWPGLGVKRWLLLMIVGAAITGIGLVYLLLLLRQSGWLPPMIYHIVTVQFLPPWLRMLAMVSVGLLILLAAVMQIGRRLVAPFRRPDDDLGELLFQHQRRAKGPHIVAIGGGTGLPTLLRGLKRHTANITAIVTVADDGGSSGRLRQELGLHPPGDFRNNLAALARDEALMTQLLQYRFGGRSEEGQEGRQALQGHAFGNLLLAALSGITGSFEEGLLAAERVLALRGRVLPSTVEEVSLVADITVTDAAGRERLERVTGESAIPKTRGRIRRVYLEPGDIRAHPPTLRAIFQADLIILGPGSLYTSILPNLLVPDLAGALARTPAPKVYICNLAVQPGETDNYDVADHLAAILAHVPDGCIDYVVANDNFLLPHDQGGGRTRYIPLGDVVNKPLITADLVDEQRPWRHDSEKLAQTIWQLLDR